MPPTFRVSGWRKSSRSQGANNCVEVGRVTSGAAVRDTKDRAGWRKSSRSQGAQNCVEVGRITSGAAVRDTKDRAGGYITVTGDQWMSFLNSIKDGRFDI